MWGVENRQGSEIWSLKNCYPVLLWITNTYYLQGSPLCDGLFQPQKIVFILMGESKITGTETWRTYKGKTVWVPLTVGRQVKEPTMTVLFIGRAAIYTYSLCSWASETVAGKQQSPLYSLHTIISGVQYTIDRYSSPSPFQLSSAASPARLSNLNSWHVTKVCCSLLTNRYWHLNIFLFFQSQSDHLLSWQ